MLGLSIEDPSGVENGGRSRTRARSRPTPHPDHSARRKDRAPSDRPDAAFGI